MRTWGIQLMVFGAAATGCLLSFLGCTDRRPPPPAAPVVYRTPPQPPPRTSVESVAEVRFQNADTTVLAMTRRGNSVFLTGRPFGFMRWDVGANPESPRLTFAASDDIVNFAPKGKWVVDWYASGAVGILGSYGFLSGTSGMSVVDISSTSNPAEVLRIPDIDPNSDKVGRDLAYVYKAIVPHPSLPVLYGFREQDFVYTLSAGSGGVNITSKSAYGKSGEPVCCVRSAVIFGNRLFVAFLSRLVWFDISGGRLGSPGEFSELQAANVTASDNLLYVQHEPNRGQPAGYGNPRGIYVFNLQGENVDFIPLDVVANQIIVDPTDSYLYVNSNNITVDVFRINWAER